MHALTLYKQKSIASFAVVYGCDIDAILMYCILLNRIRESCS